MKITINSIDNIQKAAKEFLSLSAGRKVFAFYGSMGAGKTTFIKALCSELNAVDIATSPTFTLVNEYLMEDGDYIYHFDFYRIEKAEEAFDFGFEEYLYSGNYCFIEWPEKIESLLPELVVPVKITVDENQHRMLDISL